MKQTEALEVMKTGSNVFLTGEPGAGKTYTIGELMKHMSKKGMTYAITASTGISASHINGSTIHSWSGIGIKRDLDDYDATYIAGNNRVQDRMKYLDVLIIDEVSMLDATTINDVELVMRKARSKEEPFGGVQIIFVGDFYQLPPVSKDREVRFAFESEAWNKAQPEICYITEQHRQSDRTFLDILSAMRNGTLTEEQKQILIDSKKLKEKPESQLFTHNADVDRLNNAELAKIKKEEHKFRMTESGIPYMVETLKRSCLSPETLVLKEGALVMFTRNDFDAGYVNGSIGKVEKIDENGIRVKLQSGRTVYPKKAEWSIEQNGDVKARIKQIPLRLAWAITVHKSQGMSLDSARVDLSKTFEYGQGYVAISRVRTLEGLHLEGVNDKAFEMHPKVVQQDKVFRGEEQEEEECQCACHHIDTMSCTCDCRNF